MCSSRVSQRFQGPEGAPGLNVGISGTLPLPSERAAIVDRDPENCGPVISHSSYLSHPQQLPGSAGVTVYAKGEGTPDAIRWDEDGLSEQRSSLAVELGHMVALTKADCVLSHPVGCVLVRRFTSKGEHDGRAVRTRCDPWLFACNNSSDAK